MQKTLTILILVLLANSLFAQSTTEHGFPFVRYYTPKEYDGSSQVWCALQDNRGIMYFGDISGVFEFDGSTWKRIYTPSKTIVRSLAIDSIGRIYVGSFDEFGYLKPDKSGNLEYTSLSELLPENERRFQDIHKIIVDYDKVYYFARNHIYIYSENRIKTIKAELFASYAFQYNSDIYAIHKYNGICLIHDSILEPAIQFNNSIQNLISIISFPDNKILIPEIRANWKLYDLTSKQFEKFETPAQKYINEHGIYYTTRVDENKFAVATRTGGVIILSNTGEIIQVLNEDKGLPAGKTYFITTDNTGNLWFCMEKGICKVDINYPATIAGKLQNMDESVLSSNLYNGIRYIGTLNGIYYLKENTISKNYNPVYHKTNSSDNSCWALVKMNNLLIAGGGSYLLALKDSTHKVLHYLNGLTSLCLANSKKYPDILFFGVHNRLGFLRLNPQATFENVNVLDEGYFPEIDDVVFNITEDNDGNLWVSTQNNGIYFIRFENSDVKNYKITHLSTNNGLPNILETRTFVIDNHILVTTQNGILQANLPGANEPDSLTRFTYTNYFGKEIKRPMEYILKVDENNYLLTGESIMQITKTSQGIEIDSSGFNRLISGFNELHPFLNDDKTISFGTTEGYIHYNTKSNRDFSKPFNVAIRKVTIDNDSVLFNGSFYQHSDSLRVPVLNQTADELPDIDFKLNSVTFQYSGLFYEEPQATQYSYKLVGYSKKWSDWSNENKAVFTNLKEGDYSFQVKARNVYLAESYVTDYRFKIHHPWYLAWWAYLLYVLFLVGIILLIVKLSVYRLRKQNEHLERIVSERTKEIKQQKEKIELQNTQLEKYNRERVKELQAFFALSKVVEDNNINVDKICWALLRILSQSFQFPEITFVRIVIDDKIYESTNYNDSEWKISAPVYIGEAEHGRIDVVYTEEKPKEYEGPFLKEEGMLISAMAERLGHIIKRLHAEEKILENKERLQNIFNNLQDAYFEADLTGKFTTISPSAIAIFGCSSFEEIQKMRAQDLYADPKDREKLLSLLKKKKSVSDFVCLGKRKDDSTFWVSMSVQFKYNNDGEICGTIGLVRDITERKNAEEKIISSKLMIEEIINLVPASIFWKDKNLTYLGCNTAFASNAGFNNPNEIIGQDDYQMVWREQAELYRKDDREVIENKSTKLNIEEQQTTPDGNTITLLTNKIPMRNSKGEITGILGIYIDITERKLAELELIKAKEKAEESNRLKTAFMNNISHEIRTPLNGILGFASIVIQPDISDEKKQVFLKILNTSSERLMNTITDYMDISLIVSGAMPVNIVTVDIESLINELYYKFNEAFNEKNLQLNLQKPANKNGFVLITDEGLLNKVISHLLYNALKFTEEGNIILGYGIKQSNLEIFVKDTGVGIAPDALERIFEVFMQENVSNTRAHEGSGLGLSIANGLTKLLGGNIRIESEKLKGTSVFINLPIELVTTPDNYEVLNNRNEIKRISKLLIVEDDDVSYLYLETILESLSANIIRAIDGEEAIEICQKNADIELILMDVQLPVLNGYEVTRKIRQFNNDVIIVAQTAYGHTGDREKALDAGCNDYISKPIKKVELISLIQKYFDN